MSDGERTFIAALQVSLDGGRVDLTHRVLR
jgi:hypothetical protein